MEERSLVLIKPDAVSKKIVGNIISDLNSLNLKMVGLKLVNVNRELAERHYSEHKDKPFYSELIDYISGKLHNENVVAIAYKGRDAVKKIRDVVGDTHPDKASPSSLRGKYGKIHSLKNWFETVVHASDSKASAEREISLWFSKDELVG
jgi:nucleoside-diphosphate kinase